MTTKGTRSTLACLYRLLTNRWNARVGNESLPQGFQGFWISSPASIIRLVRKDTES